MPVSDAPERSRPEVADALAAGRPVVALESTIITHGMPLSAEPRDGRAGRGDHPRRRRRRRRPSPSWTAASASGSSRADLERLAETGAKAAKASRRDVAALLSSGGIAGTTVATTMQAADMAGIQVFATGGIGGVHRGAESTFDISADLEELAPHAGRGGLRRRQVHPRYPQDARSARDQGRAGDRLRHRRFPGVLDPLLAAIRSTTGSTRPRRSRR